MSVSIDDVVRRSGEWLRGDGPLHEIVISSRIRLARNIDGYPFLTRADAATRANLVSMVLGALKKARQLDEYATLDIDGLDELDRRVLVERHLISRQHAESEGARQVAFRPDEQIAMMINEEDHLRIQVMRSGFRLAEAWEQISAVDTALEAGLEFAFDERLGYLTACPTNVGTGIRVSVMLHLPALKLSGEIERVFRAAKGLKLAVRGLYGEGTTAAGDFYQISNQITLGRSESEIIDEFQEEIIPRIVQYEADAREVLLQERQAALDDKIWRAVGVLKHARLMSSDEAMECLSHLRLGVHSGRLTNVDVQTVNELFLQTQPAHLQKLQGERLNGEQRSVARAALIRTRLSNN
jgi:protein arginine kinase